jgi:xylose isomerase
MDAFARGLQVAARMSEDGALSDFLKRRYASYNDGIGRKIEKGQTNFKELEAYVLKHGEPKRASGKQELLENIINQYLFA